MKATLGGTEIAYDTRGQGRALLFLHAFPLGQFMWDTEAEAFSGSHRVVRFDARGFGDTPADPGPLTMARIADDGAALLGLLGIEATLVVVGEDDALPPPNESEAMASAIAGSRLEVIPRAGHLSNLENPEAYRAALAGFLAELG